MNQRHFQLKLSLRSLEKQILDKRRLLQSRVVKVVLLRQSLMQKVFKRKLRHLLQVKL